MSKKNIILFVGFVIVATCCVLLFLKRGYPIGGQADYENSKKPVQVTMEFWGLWDNSDSWQSIIDKFEKETHNWNGQDVQVKINYTKKDIASYEAEVQKAYDENKSPSLYIINNYWLERYSNKLEPLTGNVAYINEYNLLDYEKLQEIFPPYILQDVLKGNEMFAVPIYSDSLALYYNKDLFQKAGIATPPATWEDFKADVKKLTIAGKKNEIKQSGVAMGGGKNINRSCDILSLLMMQGGGKIVDSDGNIDFNKKISIKTAAGAQDREPGLTGIQFFMQFSDPNKEIYAWNDSFTNSIEDFANGKTAMMFGYNYQRANLLALKPDLNYGIAPVPQLANSTPIDISNVWFPVVSNQKTCTVTQGNADNIDCGKIAWSFLSFAAQKENVVDYLNTSDKAAARLDLIQEQSQKDDLVNAFAKQATITRSYNKFNDQIDNIFTNMLDEIYGSRNDWKAKADAAAAKIEELKPKAQ